MHEHPGDDADQYHESRHGRSRRGHHPTRTRTAQEPTQQAEHDNAERREQEVEGVRVLGEEDGDDEDRDQVVEHRERHQEHTDAAGQPAPEDRQNSERECDVGRRGDGPAVLPPAAGGERQIHQGRCRDSAHRRDGRVQCAVPRA
jgi:hypothetical protein